VQTLFSALVMISALGLIVSVLLQEGAENGLGALAGSAPEQLWGKNRSTSREATLQRATIISAVIFIISTLVLAAN